MHKSPTGHGRHDYSGRHRGVSHGQAASASPSSRGGSDLWCLARAAATVGDSHCRGLDASWTRAGRAGWRQSGDVRHHPSWMARAPEIRGSAAALIHGVAFDPLRAMWIRLEGGRHCRPSHDVYWSAPPRIEPCEAQSHCTDVSRRKTRLHANLPLRSVPSSILLVREMTSS